jgi:hypothetical protein
MFNQVCENFRQATETTVRLQQEMFKTWINLWPGAPVASESWVDQMHQFQKKSAETYGEILKRQRDMVAANYKAGLKNIEKAFQIGEAKTPEELRAKSIELWQNCFEDLGKACEAQLRGFEAVIEKWGEIATKAAK